jgi:DNA-binding transcriptional ArsR family regulator
MTGGARNTADNEQETKPPSHGYNPVEREGDLAATQEHNGTGSEADADSKMLQRLRQVIDATELLSTQKVILAVIIAESDDEFYCDLGYEEIAARAGVSRRVVATHIPILERSGWIEKQGSSKRYSYRYLK